VQRIPIYPEVHIHRKPPPGTVWHDPPFAHGLVWQAFGVGFGLGFDAGGIP
jgi:hypothetical protein